MYRTCHLTWPDLDLTWPNLTWREQEDCDGEGSVCEACGGDGGEIVVVVVVCGDPDSDNDDLTTDSHCNTTRSAQAVT